MFKVRFIGLRMLYNTVVETKEARFMDFWDGVNKGADEQWEFENSMRGHGGGGNTGCLDAFLKYGFVAVIVYAILKLIFGD